MQVKGMECCKIGGKLVIAGAFLVASTLVGSYALAQVQGNCVTCHTMHNSQDSNTQVHVGAGAGWNAGTLTGGTDTAQDQLLKSDCVGCHSSTDNSTTIVTDVNGNRIPIVYNMGGYPATALAGGNFFSVATTDSHGHNVRGVSAADATLALAPGATGGCASSCHTSLTLTDAATQQPSVGYKFNGCKGCHTQVGHHNANDASYRFLGGHGAPGVTYVDGGGVAAPGSPNPYEAQDGNWEQNPGDDNNFYKKQSGAFELQPASVGRFCAGCHGSFHAMGGIDPITGVDNGGDDNTDGFITANSTPVNPWLRHPTNVNIPNDGEYAQMFGASYSKLVPVAQDPAGNAAIIDAGDQVMCLSCHRAHASDKPDALRFDYTIVNAHNMGADSTVGCFFCHRSKDL